MKEKRLEGIIKQASRFKNLRNAQNYSDRSLKPSAVIHGDDGYYWVVTLGEAELLYKNGYEYAPKI